MGLSVRYLNFLTEWWLSSKNEYPKSWEVEAANFLKSWYGNRHCISSGVFYWSISHRVQVWGEGTWTSYLDGRPAKLFKIILHCKQSDCFYSDIYFYYKKNKKKYRKTSGLIWYEIWENSRSTLVNFILCLVICLVTSTLM